MLQKSLFIAISFFSFACTNTAIQPTVSYDGYYAISYHLKEANEEEKYETQFKIEDNQSHFEFTDKGEHHYKVDIQVDQEGQMNINAMIDQTTMTAVGQIDSDRKLYGTYVMKNKDKSAEGVFSGHKLTGEELSKDPKKNMETWYRMFATF